MLAWTMVVGAQMDRSGRLGFTVEDDVTRSDGGMEKESEAKMLTPRILAWRNLFYWDSYRLKKEQDGDTRW